jgi:hypothetical protein
VLDFVSLTALRGLEVSFTVRRQQLWRRVRRPGLFKTFDELECQEEVLGNDTLLLRLMAYGTLGPLAVVLLVVFQLD